MKKVAYWAGQFFSVHMRIPDLYPKFVGHRRAWMYWAVNPDPDTRGVIIALNGIDESWGSAPLSSKYATSCPTPIS